MHQSLNPKPKLNNIPYRGPQGFEKSKDSVSSSGRIANDSGGSSGTRFAVEIPLLESSGTATATLACSFLASLQQQRQAASPVSSSSKAAALGNVTLVFADAAAASAAAAQVPTLGLVGSTVRVWGLVEACRQSSLGGLLVMVAPAVADVSCSKRQLFCGGLPWSGVSFSCAVLGCPFAVLHCCECCRPCCLTPSERIIP